MSQNDIIIRTHYKSPHRMHIDSDIPTPSSEPINQFARQLITLLDTSDLSSMLSYCVTQEFTANCRKISQNCYSTALFTINFATSPIHAENILITLHYKKEIISLLLETTPIKANHLRSILDYIEQEQLTAENRNHCMKLSKKIHREKTIQPTVNLNGSAFFSQSPSDAIFCRHLSLQYALDSLRNGKGKVNLIKHYSSVESIQQHVPLVRDAEFRSLLRHPPAGSRVIASKDFGFALDIFFCRMMANNVSDPNDTNVAVRGTHRTARGFLSLDKFISSGPDAQTWADRYVRNCAIAFLPLLPEGVPGAIFAGIASRMPFAPIHPSAMLLIMATGQTQQLITLFKQLPILPEKEIIEIITAQNSVGTPALFLAMMNGHTDNVKIFMQEIQSLVDNHIIHEDNLVKLLQTKSANETPGLYISMLYGFDEIIDIFLNALTTPITQELLSKKMVMDILAMKTRDGEPGLYAAMENNHPLCVTRFLSKVYGIAVKYNLSKINIMDLLKGATAHGTPALYIAMSKGNKDVVLSYISTLGTFAKKYSFSQCQLFTLLAAKNHDNMSAVHIAIHHNHYKTVETYYAAINVISQSLSFSADELKTYL
ncbi:ShET2/EspL2 family type III secretion system effector toxin [Escherichia coli]